MKFNVVTEEEINHKNLLEPGIYQFQVLNAEDCISKRGNEMIKLVIKVWDKDNHKPYIIYDYLLEAFPHKIKHFTDVTNLAHRYQSGVLCAEDCINNIGYAHVVISSGDGEYPDRNSIKDYVKSDEKINMLPNNQQDILEEEDIPF